MTNKIKLKLIQVIIDGVKWYLSGTSCLDPNAITKNPLTAYNYLELDPAGFRGEVRPLHNLKQHLSFLNIKGAKSFSKSGIWVDCLPEIIEMEIAAMPIEVDIARLPERTIDASRLPTFSLRLLSVLTDAQVMEYYNWLKDIPWQDYNTGLRWERHLVVEEMAMRLKEKQISPGHL